MSVVEIATFVNYVRSDGLKYIILLSDPLSWSLTYLTSNNSMSKILWLF